MSARGNLAAIDIGTNSTLLLITDATGRPLLERTTITRLGEDCDKNGVLGDPAIARTLACLEDYSGNLRHSNVDRLAVVATSAARDAANGMAFSQQVQGILGLAPTILQGTEEATLTFHGAIHGLPIRTPAVGVFDIGGGSTEFVQGLKTETNAFAITNQVSLNLGSVRLTERFLHSDPPDLNEVQCLRRAVASELSHRNALPNQAPGHGRFITPPAMTWVGVAGTVTSLAAVALKQERYDGTQIHGSHLDRSAVARLTHELAALPIQERQQVVGLEPKRADIIVAGALLVDEFLSWAGAASCLVSDRGVRWGLIQRLLAE